jgi:hypothetical protein
VPKANADKTYADLYIVDFNLHKGELLWFWKSQVYFKVVGYVPVFGWAVGVGDTWDTRDYPPPGGWKTDVEKDTWYTVNYHNQVEYDFPFTFVRYTYVTFAFYAYKNGWWGDHQLLAHKVNFDLRPGRQEHPFKNNDIEFNVVFDWEPCKDGQIWTGTACVCPENQEWNGQQCVHVTTTVDVYSLPTNWQDPPANSVSSDLGATISVKYTLNGLQPPVLTQHTPFNFQADIGSQMTFFDVKRSGSDWSFACNWDHYGIGRHPGECTLTTTVEGNDQIVAFFIVRCPDGQSWTGSECACPSGQEWNGEQCVIPTPSCPDGQCVRVSVCPWGQEWNGQQCVQEELSVDVFPNPILRGRFHYLSYSGSGFTPNGRVRIKISPENFGWSATADGSGSISGRIEIADNVGVGPHELKFTDESTGRSTTVSLMVEAEPVMSLENLGLVYDVDPNTGGEVTVSGDPSIQKSQGDVGLIEWNIHRYFVTFAS